MTYRILVALLMSTSLMISANANAQFGKIEDVIQAAIEGKEPAYIAELMGGFKSDLVKFVNEKRIRMSKEKLALLISMEVMLEATVCTADSAASTALWSIWTTLGNSYPYIAAEASKNAVASSALANASFIVGVAGQSAAGRCMARHAFDDSLWNLAWSAAVDIARNTVLEANARGMSETKTGVIAYRVAEWRILNGIFLHPEPFLSVTYGAVLNALLEDNNDTTIFDDPYEWRRFRERHFSDLRQSALIVAPWLSVLDELMLPIWTPQTNELFPLEDRLVAQSLMAMDNSGPQSETLVYLGFLPRAVNQHLVIPYLMTLNGDLRMSSH